MAILVYLYIIIRLKKGKTTQKLPEVKMEIETDQGQTGDRKWSRSSWRYKLIKVTLELETDEVKLELETDQVQPGDRNWRRSSWS